MNRDRGVGLETLVKIVPLHHPSHRVASRQLDHPTRTQRIAPFAVVADLGSRRIENQAGLLVVGLGVGLDLFARQRRSGVVAPGRVANHRCKVADQENDLMPQILQLAHLVQNHRVTDVNIRRGRIEAELDPQRLTGGLGPRELPEPVSLRQELLAIAKRDCHRLAYPIGDWIGLSGASGFRHRHVVRLMASPRPGRMGRTGYTRHPVVGHACFSDDGGSQGF